MFCQHSAIAAPHDLPQTDAMGARAIRWVICTTLRYEYNSTADAMQDVWTQRCCQCAVSVDVGRRKLAT